MSDWEETLGADPELAEGIIHPSWSPGGAGEC